MKKQILVFVLVLLLAFGCMAPVAGATVPRSNRGTALRIDATYLYPGMDNTYQGGYSPTVSDGQAQIVLPLIDGAGSQQVKSRRGGQHFSKPWGSVKSPVCVQ